MISNIAGQRSQTKIEQIYKYTHDITYILVYALFISTKNIVSCLIHVSWVMIACWISESMTHLMNQSDWFIDSLIHSCLNNNSGWLLWSYTIMYMFDTLAMFLTQILQVIQLVSISFNQFHWSFLSFFQFLKCLQSFLLRLIVCHWNLTSLLSYSELIAFISCVLPKIQ